MNSPRPIERPSADSFELMFPGMPHEVHRALWTLLNHAGSLNAAGALLAEYALKVSRK